MKNELNEALNAEIVALKGIISNFEDSNKRWQTVVENVKAENRKLVAENRKLKKGLK
jgi:septin family protein